MGKYLCQDSDNAVKRDEPTVAEKLEKLLGDEGSEHYKQGSVQPAVFIRANDMPFFEGSAVKYIARHKHSENGRRDLEKAIHYLRMIIVCDYGEEEEVPLPF